MAEGPPKHLNALDQRLRNYCKGAGLDFQRARTHLGALVAAQFMRAAGTVAKGGRGLEFRLGLADTRVTSDFDGVRTRSVELTIDALQKAGREGWAGFTATTVDAGPISGPDLPDAYRPHRLNVKLQYKGRSFLTVDVELSAEEAGSLERVDLVESRDGTPMFEAVGLPAPDSVKTLLQPVQFAQKLHAVTQPDTDRWRNDRVRDLVDMQLLWANMGDDDRATTPQWCRRVFSTRREHGWPPDVTLREEWVERYEVEASGIGRPVAPTLKDALGWLAGLLDEF